MGVAVLGTEGREAFTPLAAELNRYSAERLESARRRLEGYSRNQLIQGFHNAFTAGKRVLGHLVAEQLVERATPPCFWYERLDLRDTSWNQRYDLFMADLLWLRRWHRGHVTEVRYQRYRLMLHGTESDFQREAEYAFWAGRRPVWQLVKSLSLTEGQQWECLCLRSTPVQKRAALIDAESVGVLELLRDGLGNVRRTSTFGEAEAAATLRRRHAIWRCWRMVGNTNPTAIASRYQQLTGEPISRQLVANHLEKIQSTIKGKKMKTR